MGRERYRGSARGCVFKMSQLSFWETPLFAPCEDVKIDALRGFGAPGERVALSFSVSSMAPQETEIEIENGDLTGENSSIAREKIACFVVKEWVQSGIGMYQTAPERVLELLVKDDREVLRDNRSRRCAHWKHPAHWRHLARTPKFYCPPRIRLEGNVRTVLWRNERKQIWLETHVPNDAPAGKYRGFLEISIGKNSSKTERLALEIEVLPIRLLQPTQDFFIWYKGTLDCVLSQHHVSRALFTAQLRDIFAHGFTSFSLHESCPRFLQKALDLAHEIGFCRNVVLSICPQKVATIDFHDMTPVFYLSDEIDMRGEKLARAHFGNWHNAKAHNAKAQSRDAKTMASLVHQSAARKVFQRLETHPETADSRIVDATPDILSCYLPDNCHYFAMRSRFAHLQNQMTYFYWLSHMEKPNLHRVLAGLWLAQSGAEGIAPYCYQHLPPQNTSPFDDFAAADVDAPDLDPTNADRTFKALMTTYPAANGSIATLQWKGLSLGIGDLKYLTTLEDALKNASERASPANRVLESAVRQRTQAFLERLSLVNIEIRSSAQREPYAQIAPHEYADFREQMARDIVALQSVIDEVADEKPETARI